MTTQYCPYKGLIKLLCSAILQVTLIRCTAFRYFPFSIVELGSTMPFPSSSGETTFSINCPPESAFALIKCLNPGEDCGQADRIDLCKYCPESLFVVRKVVKKKPHSRGPKYSEVEILRDILRPHQNPHICQWVSSYDCPSETRLYVEYCSYGDLDQVAEKYEEQKQAIPESLLWHIFFSVAKGLAFIHFGLQWQHHKQFHLIPNWKTMLHRDLKPANIFMQKAADGQLPIVKIGDFGHAVQTSDPGFDPNSGCGTRVFLPPETPLASTGGDVWSLGSTLTFMCISRPTKRILGDCGKLYGRGLETLNEMRIKDAGYSREFAEGVGKTVKQVKRDRINAMDLVKELEPLMELLQVYTAFQGFPEWAVPKQFPGAGEEQIQLDVGRPARGMGFHPPLYPDQSRLTRYPFQSHRPSHGTSCAPPPSRYSSDSFRPTEGAPTPLLTRHQPHIYRPSHQALHSSLSRFQSLSRPFDAVPSPSLNQDSVQIVLAPEPSHRRLDSILQGLSQDQSYPQPPPPPPRVQQATPAYHQSVSPGRSVYGPQAGHPGGEHGSINIRWSWTRGFHDANSSPQRNPSYDQKVSRHSITKILGKDIRRNRDGHLQFERGLPSRNPIREPPRALPAFPALPAPCPSLETPLIDPLSRPQGRRQMPLAFDNRPGRWHIPAPETSHPRSESRGGQSQISSSSHHSIPSQHHNSFSQLLSDALRSYPANRGSQGNTATPVAPHRQSSSSQHSSSTQRRNSLSQLVSSALRTPTFREAQRSSSMYNPGDSLEGLAPPPLQVPKGPRIGPTAAEAAAAGVGGGHLTRSASLQIHSTMSRSHYSSDTSTLPKEEGLLSMQKRRLASQVEAQRHRSPKDHPEPQRRGSTHCKNHWDESQYRHRGQRRDSVHDGSYRGDSQSHHGGSRVRRSHSQKY